MWWSRLSSCEYTHCVGLFGVMPTQGCETILIEILQLKRSAAGPHFPCYFLMSKETYNRSWYIIGILKSILLGRASFAWNNVFLHILSSVFPQRYVKSEKVFSIITSTAKGAFTNRSRGPYIEKTLLFESHKFTHRTGPGTDLWKSLKIAVSRWTHSPVVAQ